MVFEGLTLIECNALYNILQQGTFYSRLSDPNYLLLIDARSNSGYNESHIITSKKAPKNRNGDFVVLYDAELECKQHTIVYDSNTSDLRDCNAPAMKCGHLLWESGSRNFVKILKARWRTSSLWQIRLSIISGLEGGYEKFSALYPFLRTQRMIYMPRVFAFFLNTHRKELDELKSYPVEVLHGFLYIGNWRQGNAAYVQKDLKLKAHVCVCLEAETFFPNPGPELLHLRIEDSNEDDILRHFENACSFIENHRQSDQAVLVFDHLGISGCVTIVIAYLMKLYNFRMDVAYNRVQNSLPTLRPNRSFIEQLSLWEEILFGENTTNVDDPHF